MIQLTSASILSAYTQDAYHVKEFRLARCSCGSEAFSLEVDHEEEVAKRRCVVCGEEHFVGDSEEYWKNAQPKKWSCIECRSDQANVGVGFSLYDDGEVHWLYLGERCSGFGVLGSSADWKIFAAPDGVKLVALDGASNKRLQRTRR
jgi:hypothetical protein